MKFLRTGHVASRWQHQEMFSGELVILDNRDSFVYNLAHRFEELGVDELGLRIVVTRSDEIDLDTLLSWQPRALVLSPGPGHPADAGISVAAVRALSGVVPILGVCLGHQAIAHAFGGLVEPSGRPRHGMASPVEHQGQGIFRDLPSPVSVARYHSLVAREPLPDVLEAQAWTDGFIMAIAHREHPTFGVQFHPESILSEAGYGILKNFLSSLREG